MIKVQNLFEKNKIIPIVTIENAADAIPLAEVLYKAGARIIEVTLRTPDSLTAIKEIANLKPNLLIGAGTIITTDDLENARRSGAKFFISPGVNRDLLKAANKEELAYMPGVSSASDIMMAKQFGAEFLKFFPAEASGGVKMLKIFSEVFRGVKFCPTGGIEEKNLKEYLSLENVFAIGGSWLAPKNLIAAKRWEDIEKIAAKTFSQI